MSFNIKNLIQIIIIKSDLAFSHLGKMEKSMFTMTKEQDKAAEEMVRTIMKYDEASQQDKDDSPRHTKDVLLAFRHCPRHVFCAEKYKKNAYEDRALPISGDQVITQPCLVAMMTQLLCVKKGDRVLEIGTGSGYQAAILATMGVEVCTIEIIEKLYLESEPKLRVMFPDLVSIRRGDGFDGWPERAPFDAIVVTAGIDKTPSPLLKQLKMNGKIVIPLEDGRDSRHILYCYTKTDKGLIKKPVSGCCFVPFVREI